ncbi:PREDICTED: uncharacterized protein LOC105312106 [Amphimedon queenslandica]|uniref:Uncharacterized protein n=1 Tax=Amphimedon queenslandica TaxID=400682 RepID=A0A1X7V9E6_AMPQE|nr:PREDICTED: uncharacterized protein LOC105312106 [Amphimedon queenslandica]|eukprot:XP_011402785.1 PREDICTED: uncharacterized protein LOC105312106 [Amphimedon queenslandica]
MSQLLVKEGTTTAPAQENGDLNDFTKVVTVSFIELFLMDEMKKEGTIGTRSPGAARSDMKPLVRESPEEIVSLTQNQVALEVAEKLKMIGDEIDARLKSEVNMALKGLYDNQSIWEVGYSQFRGTLQGVFSRCHDAVKNGWEQVSVVYTVAGRLVGELRVQQEEIGGMRENQMQGFANTYLRDSGIQQWVEQQGGMTKETIGPPTGELKVTITDED